MQRAVGLAVAVATGVANAASSNPLTPEGVSPGSVTTVITASGSCPTFSWAADPGDGFELTVLAVSEEPDADPWEIDHRALPSSPDTLLISLPGGALSWTPAPEQCLRPGTVYGWAIRPVMDGVVTEWSKPLLFRVSLEPTAEEVARAAAILARARAHPDTPVERSAPPSETIAPSTQAEDESITFDGDPGMSVDGIVEVYGLLSQLANGSDNILAEGNLSTPLGIMEAPLVYINPGGQLPAATWLRSPALGELEIGRGTGSEPDAEILVDLLIVNSLSTTVLKSATGLGWIGSGGTGVVTVPLNGSNQLRLDSAGDECPAGSVATGLRLKKVDSNQAGVELECSD